jgi:hypothetical protein
MQNTLVIKENLNLMAGIGNTRNLIFRGPCIMIYSYNKSQQDALFIKFIFGKELYMFQIDLPSIIRSFNTVYAAIGICHASYVDCLLARSGWNWFSCVDGGVLHWFSCVDSGILHHRHN